MGRFQLHRQKGAKNAKKGESESKKEQKLSSFLAFLAPLPGCS